jgi:predicted transcriptional regulator
MSASFREATQDLLQRSLALREKSAALDKASQELASEVYDLMTRAKEAIARSINLLESRRPINR